MKKMKSWWSRFLNYTMTKKWKADNGFKNGYPKHLQSMIESKLRGHEILANPYIESRIKTLKAKYVVLYEILNQSGFSQNEQEMMLVCKQSVFNEWVEVNVEVLSTCFTTM